MDIHEWFCSKEENLKKLVSKIEENTDGNVSSWELFEAYLRELLNDHDERACKRIINIAVNPYDEPLQHHEKLEKAHQALCDFDYELKKLVYYDGKNTVSIDYNHPQEE